MSSAEIREWVRTSRAAQGLPPTLDDPVILDRLAVLFNHAAAERVETGGDHAHR